MEWLRWSKVKDNVCMSCCFEDAPSRVVRFMLVVVVKNSNGSSFGGSAIEKNYVYFHKNIPVPRLVHEEGVNDLFRSSTRHAQYSNLTALRFNSRQLLSHLIAKSRSLLHSFCIPFHGLKNLFHLTYH